MQKGYVEKFWKLSARFSDEEVSAELINENTVGVDGGSGGQATPELKVVPKPEVKADSFKETLKILGPEFEEAFKEGGPEALKAAVLEGVRARHELQQARRPPAPPREEPDPDAIYDEIENIVEQQVDTALRQLPRGTTEQEAWKVAQRVAARTRNRLLHELALKDAVGIVATERQNAKIRDTKREAFFNQRQNADLLEYADIVEELVEEHGYDGPVAAALARKFIKRHQEVAKPKEDLYDEDEHGVAVLQGLNARQTRALQRTFKASGGRRSQGRSASGPGNWTPEDQETSNSFWGKV